MSPAPSPPSQGIAAVASNRIAAGTVAVIARAVEIISDQLISEVRAIKLAVIGILLAVVHVLNALPVEIGIANGPAKNIMSDEVELQLLVPEVRQVGQWLCKDHIYRIPEIL